jgi:hypothetical protein
VEWRGAMDRCALEKLSKMLPNVRAFCFSGRWEQSLLMLLLKRLMLPLRLAIIAILLQASAVGSQESSRDVALPTGDVWSSVEPLLEYRPLPTIEWLPVLPDGSIDDTWLRRERSEQPSCAHKQAEGSAAAISHQSVKC